MKQEPIRPAKSLHNGTHYVKPPLYTHPVRSVFLCQHSNGIGVVKDLYVEGVYASFALTGRIIWPTLIASLLQIRDLFQNGYQSFPELPPETPTDILLATKASLKGAITRIYDTITNITPQPTTSVRIPCIF